MNIQKYIKNYFRKKSLFSIASDFIFIIIILLLLVPGTRKETMSFFIRATLFIKNPSFKTEKTIDTAYQWKLKGINTNDTVVQFSTQVVFVNFWATWCPPCRAEMPGLQKLYNEFNNKLVFLFISDEHPQVIKDYIEKNEYTLPVYQADNVPFYFSSNALPTTYIVKKDKIILEKKGAMNWNGQSFKKQLMEIVQSN